MTTTPTTVVVGRPRRLETHTVRVSVDLDGAPEHRTPRGRAPMTPRHVHVEYHLPNEDGGGGLGVTVELLGPPVRAPRYGERYIPNMTRRIRGGELDGQPAWLLDLIEFQRPATWRGEVPAAGGAL